MDVSVSVVGSSEVIVFPTNERIGRRPVVAGAALLGVGLTLGSCAVGSSESGGESGELRVTWWGSDSANSAINAALDIFTEERDIEVARETQAWDGYWDRLATQTAGGNAPDLIMQAGSQIPDYASRNTLLNLNDAEGLDVEAVDEGLRQFGAVDDALYGVVAASNAMGLVANEDLLAEAGLSLPEEAYSWEDLAQMATATHEALGEDIWGISDGGGNLIQFIMKIRDDGRQFYADDGSLNATPDDLTAWLEFWDALRENGGAPPADVSAEGQGGHANAPLAQRRCAMDIAWTQDYIAFARLMDNELSINLPPYVAENPSLWMNAASLWSISSTMDNPEPAVELINHFINNEEAIAALGVSLGMPPSQAARQQLAGSLESVDQSAMDYMQKVAETSTPLNRLWPAGFAQLRTLLGDLNEAVAFGSTPIPEAVDQFFTAASEYE